MHYPLRGKRPLLLRSYEVGQATLDQSKSESSCLFLFVVHDLVIELLEPGCTLSTLLAFSLVSPWLQIA